MKKAIKIINICVLALCLFHIVFSGRVLDLFLTRVSLDLAGIKYLFHMLPYVLLILAVIGNIIYFVFCIIKKKKNFFVISSIFVILLFISTLIFTAPFKFVYSKECMAQYESDDYYDEEDDESDEEDEDDDYKSAHYDYCYRSYMYDKLFVYGGYESDEGGYLGDFGEYRYIYIPIVKKLIIIDNKIETYDVKYIEDNEIMIGDKEYSIEDDWYDES